MTGQDHRYAGHTGTLRIIVDILASLPRDLWAEVVDAWAIVSGEAEPVADECQLKGCGRVALAEFPRNKSFHEDWRLCRINWLTFHLTALGVKAVILFTLVGFATLVLVAMYP